MLNRSVQFFDEQFGRQAKAADYALNPFETQVLPHLRGEVLDLGCGLGNLSVEAAKAGCTVTALDASPAGVANLGERARALRLPINARVEDLRNFVPARDYDCVVAIGLLMFFSCPDAGSSLAAIQRAVRPGGVAAVNVLIEGTTYLDMFDDAGYCLFPANELERRFSGWEIIVNRHQDFPAPRDTIKKFHTLIARRPV